MGMDGGGSGAKNDINITPLVDILLVLLVIFMVMTPLLVTGIEITIPQAASRAQAEQIMILEQEEKPIIITVKKDGTLFWNTEIVKDWRQDLPKKVFDTYKERIDKSVFVQGDPLAMYSDVVMAVDICNRYGVETLGMMITKRPKPHKG